eukprot:6160876-Amphidinium_carterae.1
MARSQTHGVPSIEVCRFVDAQISCCTLSSYRGLLLGVLCVLHGPNAYGTPPQGSKNVVILAIDRLPPKPAAAYAKLEATLHHAQFNRTSDAELHTCPRPQAWLCCIRLLACRQATLCCVDIERRSFRD